VRDAIDSRRIDGLREKRRSEKKEDDDHPAHRVSVAAESSREGARRYTRAVKRAASSFAVLLLVACSSIQFVEVQDVDTLYFGTNRPGGVVSDAEWQTFVTDVISREFPGFTEWTATGHWRGAEEMTHVVQIAHLDRWGNNEAISRIIKEYKRRFQQESVLWIRSRGLVAPE